VLVLLQLLPGVVVHVLALERLRLLGQLVRPAQRVPDAACTAFAAEEVSLLQGRGEGERRS